jgi:exodeoxyribonuclease VII large subunit
VACPIHRDATYAPCVALQTSEQDPAPVRTISLAIGNWIARLGSVWVEGQIAEITRRPGMARAFLVLRDPSVDMSLTVQVPVKALEASGPDIVRGSLVIVHGRPEYYHARGDLSFRATTIRLRGEGELWAQLERRKRLLQEEGLFAPERKRTLPFLPGRIGLICGRASAAEHDVLTNARRRWPGVDVTVRNVAVQGAQAVPEVRGALAELDEDPSVDVIVITRGGGSLADLLPFSDEGLIRAVAAAATPVVSAIGHETDHPLLDLVADVRASTPTDAAKRVVPDVGEETALVTTTLTRLRQRLSNRIRQEYERLDSLLDRALLDDPVGAIVTPRRQDTRGLTDRLRRSLGDAMGREERGLHAETARLRALSPAATLQRGYAIAVLPDGSVLSDAAQAKVGQQVRVRLHHGSIDTTTTATHVEHPVASGG